MTEITLNAENSVAGRIASTAAKYLLKGNHVNIINAEKAIISGERTYTYSVYKQKVDRGNPYTGPFYPKTPDRILKRMTRGMLPYKKPMGRAAYKRLKVFISVPEELKNTEFKTISSNNVIKNKSLSIEQVSRRLK